MMMLPETTVAGGSVTKKRSTYLLEACPVTENILHFYRKNGINPPAV